MSEQNDLFTQFVASRDIKPVVNPYWKYEDDRDLESEMLQDSVEIPIKLKNGVLASEWNNFHPSQWCELLKDVRTYFKTVYDSFKTEAQVLCVTGDDAEKLIQHQIPQLPTAYIINNHLVILFVLPQYNTSFNTCISERFWQTYIVGEDIHPIARIHSHHILSPYQSATDFATLNSNTLELVLGNIYDENICGAVWLDVRGTSVKENVWQFEVQPSFNEVSYTVKPIPSGKIKEVKENKDAKVASERG